MKIMTEGYMLKSSIEGSFVLMGEGIRRKTLVSGEKTVMCKFEFDKGAVVPLHSHIYEQTGYLLKGKIRFIIDGKQHNLGTGDSWCIMGNVGHSAEILEDTVLIETFSPVREDYL